MDDSISRKKVIKDLCGIRDTLSDIFLKQVMTMAITCVENQQAQEERTAITHGDDIRSMSDNDLAEFLCSLMDDCSQECPGRDMCCRGKGKANGLKAWLRKSMEVE